MFWRQSRLADAATVHSCAYLIDSPAQLNDSSEMPHIRQTRIGNMAWTRLHHPESNIRHAAQAFLQRVVVVVASS
jgi:hypothetical protein